MSEDTKAMLALAIMALIAGFAVSAIATANIWKGKAIERGYALYCPTTGDFAWKGECDDG